MDWLALRRLAPAAALFATVLLPPIPVGAGEGAARAALESWIAHLNEDAPEALEAFLQEAFADTFLEQVPIEQLMAVSQQLKGAGPYELGKIESESDDAIVALLETPSGTWFRARAHVIGEPARFDGLLIQPATAPSGEEREALDWKTLDELAALLAEAGDLPGVALAWARLGGDPHVGVAGVRSADGDDRVQPGDRFHIGSITKSVTATALGALVEEGELSWDSTLPELLPGVEMNDAFGDETLLVLVRHRASIPQHLTFDDAEMTRLNDLPGTTTEQRGAYVAEVLALPELDNDFHYSNAGYAIAGYIGETASGESWETLVVEEVFEPLGLESCGIGWPATHERPDQPRGHYGDKGSRRVQGLDDYRLGAFMRPAGDVHCSVGDLARYGQAHLAGLAGKDGVMEASTIQELHRVIDEAAPYAAGWGVDPESGQHRHNGSAGTFFSYLVIDPAAEMVVAVLTNVGPQDGQAAAQRAVAEILGRFGE